MSAFANKSNRRDEGFLLEKFWKKTCPKSSSLNYSDKERLAFLLEKAQEVGNEILKNNEEMRKYLEFDEISKMIQFTKVYDYVNTRRFLGESLDVTAQQLKNLTFLYSAKLLLKYFNDKERTKFFF